MYRNVEDAAEERLGSVRELSEEATKLGRRCVGMKAALVHCSQLRVLAAFDLK